MKTRQEMIYDFMLALAPNYSDMYEALLNDRILKDSKSSHTFCCEKSAEEILNRANRMADLYLETL